MARLVGLVALLVAGKPSLSAAGSYDKHQGKNAYSGNGAEHMDGDVPRPNMTNETCQAWCAESCQCHCITLHRDGDCFRRHSCDPSGFANSGDFDVYVKNPHDQPECERLQSIRAAANDSSFDYFGAKTVCRLDDAEESHDGAGSVRVANNIHTVEACKGLCWLLDFECKGIEYMDIPGEGTGGLCEIWTRTIGSFRTGRVSGNNVYHCFNYTGAASAAPKERAVALTLVLQGLNYSHLAANATVMEDVRSRIQAAAASTAGHNLTAEDVKVVLSEGSVVADIACIVPKNVSLIAVHEALASGESALTTAVVQSIESMPGISALGTGNGGSISAVIRKAAMFEGDLANYTTSLDPLPGTDTDTTTDEDTDAQSDGAHRICRAATWPVALLLSAVATFFEA